METSSLLSHGLSTGLASLPRSGPHLLASRNSLASWAVSLPWHPPLGQRVLLGINSTT